MSNLLGNNSAIVERQIGQAPSRVFAAGVICNGFEHFLLCKRAVIRNVIDITGGLLMIGSQQEALHYVGHVAKRQRIVSPPNNYSPTLFHALSDATEVQAVSWTEESTRTKDHCLHSTAEHEAPDQAIALRLGNAVGIGIGPQRILLVQEATVAEPVDGMRAGVDETTHSCCLGRPVEILRADDIYQAIICKWTIHTHHTCQVEDNINIFDRW